MNFKPKFQITVEMNNALVAIERVRGFLDATKLSNSWVKKMQEQAFMLEAHHTTHIEGTQLTLEQSELLLQGQSVENADPDDVVELLNYQKAFEFVSSYLDSQAPISESVVREIHKKLVEGVRGNSAAPGAYRKIQNYVVNSATGKTVYTPPPSYEVPLMMAELIGWLNLDSQLNPILMAGIAQFQLVHIHPFLDGNGRAARLLSTLCLYQHGYDFKRLFTISEYYDRNRVEYYRAIQSVRENEMDMTEWLTYFTEGLATQMQELKTKGETVIKHDVLVNQASRDNDIKENVLHLLQFITENGKVTISDCEIGLKMNRRTLQRALKSLREKQYIEEISAGATDPTKYYVPIV